MLLQNSHIFLSATLRIKLLEVLEPLLCEDWTLNCCFKLFIKATSGLDVLNEKWHHQGCVLHVAACTVLLSLRDSPWRQALVSIQRWALKASDHDWFLIASKVSFSDLQVWTDKQLDGPSAPLFGYMPTLSFYAISALFWEVLVRGGCYNNDILWPVEVISVLIPIGLILFCTDTLSFNTFKLSSARFCIRQPVLE